MSYILEALKKAERERELGRVPGIGSPHETPPPRPPRRWPWVLAGVLLLNALVVAGLWWRGLQGSGDGIAPTSTPAAQLEQEIQAPVVEPRGEPENAGVPAADPVLPPPVPARRPCGRCHCPSLCRYRHRRPADPRSPRNHPGPRRTRCPRCRCRTRHRPPLRYPPPRRRPRAPTRSSQRRPATRRHSPNRPGRACQCGRGFPTGSIDRFRVGWP